VTQADANFLDYANRSSHTNGVEYLFMDEFQTKELEYFYQSNQVKLSKKLPIKDTDLQLKKTS